MCGRYTIRRIDTLLRFGAIDPAEFDTFDERAIVPRFNIAPSQDVPIVRMNSDDIAAIGLARWGLIPSWTRGKPKLQPINARAETVATSGMFRTAFNKSRCLIPADGFYEWRKLGTGPKPAKQPMFIHMADDEGFAFAGLYERWRDEAGTTVQTCTILTTVPNTLMETVHDRMPVILPREHHARWLDRKAVGADVSDLLVPYDAKQMDAYPVSTRVNFPGNQGAELIERV